MNRYQERWRCHGNPFVCCQKVDLPTCNSPQETHLIGKLLMRFERWMEGRE